MKAVDLCRMPTGNSRIHNDTIGVAAGNRAGREVWTLRGSMQACRRSANTYAISGRSPASSVLDQFEDTAEAVITFAPSDSVTEQALRALK
jgi:hypothetical protein